MGLVIFQTLWRDSILKCLYLWCLLSCFKFRIILKDPSFPFRIDANNKKLRSSLKHWYIASFYKFNFFLNLITFNLLFAFGYWDIILCWFINKTQLWLSLRHFLSLLFKSRIYFAEFVSDQRMICSSEAALFYSKQNVLAMAEGFLPNTSHVFIPLASFLRHIVLLSDLMWPAKSSPNSKADDLGDTLFSNFLREGWN